LGQWCKTVALCSRRSNSSRRCDSCQSLATDVIPMNGNIPRSRLQTEYTSFTTTEPSITVSTGVRVSQFARACVFLTPTARQLVDRISAVGVGALTVVSEAGCLWTWFPGKTKTQRNDRPVAYARLMCRFMPPLCIWLRCWNVTVNVTMYCNLW